MYGAHAQLAQDQQDCEVEKREMITEIGKFKMFHYALINGARKEDSYTILINWKIWQTFKSKYLKGESDGK
jgi:hypothetical protein